MFELIGTVVAVAFFGACLVPVMLLTMAYLGLFEPVVIEFRGKVWTFAPRGTLTSTQTSSEPLVEHGSVTGSAAATVTIIIIGQLHFGTVSKLPEASIDSFAPMESSALAIHEIERTR